MDELTGLESRGGSIGGYQGRTEMREGQRGEKQS